MTTEKAAPDAPQDPTAEPTSEVLQPQGEKHSSFTLTQKRAIVFAASIAALFSPMTGSIYFPSLNIIAADLHVSDSAINLTVTTYLIFQGIAPTFVGGFSDTAGRRPAYIICFSIYIIANLGLALQDSYAALLILRCLQSSGSSGTVALAQAVVADVATSAERGSYIGFTSVPSVLGPSLSPVIGGLLGQYLGWRAIFWFLLIFSAVFFVPFFFAFPETCRKIVGDGSIPPPLYCHSLLSWLRQKKLTKAGTPLDFTKRDELAKSRHITFPNPLATLVVVFDKETAMILFTNALLLCSFYSISTSIPSQFSKVYGFDTVDISLMFLPIGIGGLVSAFTTGFIIDWNYRRHARRLGLPVDRKRQQDLTNFPIERVRIELVLPLSCLGVCSMIAWGWSVQHHAPIAVPCVMMFILGYTLIAASNATSILLVDIYPGRPATATAANNLTRCLLGAAGTAVVLPMIDAIGLGWTNTTFALAWAAATPCLWALMRWGPKWRAERKLREQKRDAKAEDKAAEETKKEGEVNGSDTPKEGEDEARVGNDSELAEKSEAAISPCGQVRKS